jgi:cation transport protein ChaC
MAFRVPGELADEVIAYLRERELVTNVYLERRLSLQLADGRKVEAVGYIADRNHIQYAGSLSVSEAAAAVCGSVGVSGRNEDYVHNTLEHLRKMNIRDHWMEAVAAAVESRG